MSDGFRDRGRQLFRCHRKPSGLENCEETSRPKRRRVLAAPPRRLPRRAYAQAYLVRRVGPGRLKPAPLPGAVFNTRAHGGMASRHTNAHAAVSEGAFGPDGAFHPIPRPRLYSGSAPGSSSGSGSDPVSEPWSQQKSVIPSVSTRSRSRFRFRRLLRSQPRHRELRRKKLEGPYLLPSGWKMAVRLRLSSSTAAALTVSPSPPY